MKFLTDYLEIGLWALNVVLLVVLAGILLCDRHKRDFPAFTTYVVVSVLKELLLLPLSISAGWKTYFYAYWTAQLLSLALLFVVLHEVFMRVTDRAKWLPRSSRKLLIRMALASALILVGTSLVLREAGRSQITSTLISLERGAMLAVLAFMLVLILFTRRFQVPWFHRDSGIALGAIVAFSFETLWPQVGSFLAGNPQAEIYRQLVPCFYAAGFVIWIYSFHRASVVPEEPMSPDVPSAVSRDNRNTLAFAAS